MNQIKKITAILLCFILMTANIAFAEYSDVKERE